MSTRSSIGVQHADGTVSAVYCHFDGYEDGVGAALIAHHNDKEKAEALIALGDLSCVQHDGNVTAYCRDRGEPYADVAPKQFSSLEGYFAAVSQRIGDNGYRYIFHDGAWRVWGAGRNSPEVVADAIARLAALKQAEAT